MAIFLLVWSVKAWGDENEVRKYIKKIISSIERKGCSKENWSSCKDVKPGDRFFMLMMGKEPRGIIGSGWISSKSYKRKDWRGLPKEHIYADILFDTFLDPEENILHINVLERKIPNFHWKSRQRAQRLKENIAEDLEREWRAFLKRMGKLNEERIEECRKKALEIGNKKRVNEGKRRKGRKKEEDKKSERNQLELLPDEEEVENVFRKIKKRKTKRKYLEGAVKQVMVNAFERNRKAREECIKHYGTKCYVCGFDFEEMYGEIGKGFIHVHHLKPMKEIAEWYKTHKRRYKIDPKKELRPVCPNCHAMLHRKEPPLKIEELKKMIKTRR